MNHCYAKMATSCQREGGRESDPPTPRKSSAEEKPRTADNDIQQLIGHQEECPPHPKGRSFTLKQEDQQPSNIKEEEEELWITQERKVLPGSEEADVTNLPLTGVSVKTEDHEDKPPVSSQLHQEEEEEDPQPQHVKEEEEELWTTQERECLLVPLTGVSVKTEDHKGEPPASLNWFSPASVQQMIGCQEECLPQLQGSSSTLKQEEPQHLHVKEEEQELWTIQEGECLLGPEGADLTKLPLTVVLVKTEDKPPESSLFDCSPSEENRGMEPPSSRSPQHMTTEADGDHCGGSQADNLLAPLSDSDDTTSHSLEDKDSDYNQEPLSSDTDWEGDMRTHADNKQSECSKKKTRKKRFTCSVCAKSMSYKCNMTRHMLTHTGEKPFACSVCGQRFSNQSDIVRHMRIHTGEKPFCCSVCGKRFAQRDNVVSHMRTHTGEKPFGCSVCAQRFSRKSYMASHMRTHTGEKPFSCSVCGKRFSRKETMVSHMRTHTGEQPFDCSVCGKRFSRKSNMVVHMRTHTGQKPFCCSVCGESYSKNSSLTQHMRTHTGEKPFSCSVCGKSYSHKKNLTVHMQSHNGE
ncbi:zinc finger protein 773-like [Dunckerocampus dactyliophorus]|uniref:zinc finger protein 773-like n=1 Tax=Dunckerocampus dactyliophorus TaxID=161453 RepID=UPI002404EC10|nr:zinc finger protein 773-like [Dunckerocampus dactyliophorus]